MKIFRLNEALNERAGKEIVVAAAILIMVVTTITFVAGSLYIAYRGFAIIYSPNMALLGSSFFAITGVVLMRKLNANLKLVASLKW